MRTARWGPIPRLMTAVLMAAMAAACDVSVKDGSFSVDLASGKAADEQQRTYTLPPDGEFEIDNRNGSIDIAASEGDQLEVTISREARARSDEAAQTLLNQIQIREDVGPRQVRLQTDAPRDGSIRIGYVVRAPKSLVTILKLENGRVHVGGMAGDVQATVSNGSVNANGLVGPIRASTVNGPLQLELATVGGEISLATVNGPIRLTLPAAAKADVSARVVNGRIVTSGLSFDRLDQQSARALEARLNGGGTRVRLQTTNGPVVIAGRP